MKFSNTKNFTLYTLLSLLLSTATTSADEDDYHPSDCAQHEYWNKLTPSFQEFCISHGWTEDKWEEGWDWDELTPERQHYWITTHNMDQDAWETTWRHWGLLTDERRKYFEEKGMTKEIWEERYTSQDEWEKKWWYWDQLSPERQQYYKSKGIGKDEFEKKLGWDEMTPEQQQFHISRGWTQEAWDKNDKSLLSLYNEEEMEWEELSEERRTYWTARGWTEEKWNENNLEEGNNPEKFAQLPKFEPIKLRLDIPALKELNMDYLSTIDAKVGLKDGTAVGDNESFTGSEMSLKDYMDQMKNDETTLYFQLEDLDQYKDDFKRILGDHILTHLYDALSKSELREKGYFRPEWDITHEDFDKDEMLDWSLFVGSTNTTTSMHYDTDLFNFLWVVQGRKRVVMIPNTPETKGRYKLQSAFSGSGWTGIDILSEDYELPEDAVVVEVGEGEGLMFPYLCWHAVQNLEPTVAYGLRVKED